MRVRTYILLLGILCAGTLLAECNCTTRQTDVAAGTYGTTHVTCSATVLGVGASWECLASETVRHDTLFKCEGPLQGTHCNPSGNKSDYTIYTGGSCGIPTTLEELKTGPCNPPKSESSYDWSATTSSC